MHLNLDIPPRKILIIKPSSLGDIIHSLPFLSAINKCFPDAEIHWVVAKGLHVVLEKNPLIHKLWIINKDKWKYIGRAAKTIREIVNLVKGLRGEKFDLSIDLSGLLRSGLITWAGGARYKLGLAESDEGSPLFYTHKIKGGMDNHAIDRYLSIAKALGWQGADVEYPMVPFNKTPEICKNLPEEYVVIAPSAGKEANRWPAERFAKLAEKLELPSVVISSSADAAVAEKVVEKSNGKAVSMAGKTNLLELFALISKAKFFISNDTGPMHIAAAFKVPVYAIFGPANPVRTGPYGDIHTIIRKDLSCSPCYAWKPCDNWRCMENITVDMVLEKIEQK
jgi:heptosyltransferase-1